MSTFLSWMCFPLLPIANTPDCSRRRIFRTQIPYPPTSPSNWMRYWATPPREAETALGQPSKQKIPVKERNNLDIPRRPRRRTRQHRRTLRIAIENNSKQNKNSNNPAQKSQSNKNRGLLLRRTWHVLLHHKGANNEDLYPPGLGQMSLK